MPVVSLQDAKDFLNIKSTAQDVELQTFLTSAQGIVEDLVGPLGSYSFTEDIFEPGSNRIVLSRTPVLSVQSVSIAGFIGQTGTDDTASWYVDTRAGILRRKLLGGYWGFYGAGSVVTVSYTVGRTVVPQQLVKAVLYVLEAQWRSQRGASPLPASGDGAQPPMAAGYLIPEMAMEAMLPYLLPPGAA